MSRVFSSAIPNSHTFLNNLAAVEVRSAYSLNLITLGRTKKDPVLYNCIEYYTRLLTLFVGYHVLGNGTDLLNSPVWDPSILLFITCFGS